MHFIKRLLIAHYRRQIVKHVTKFTGWSPDKVTLFMNRYATDHTVADCYGKLTAPLVAEMIVVGEEDDFAALLNGELDDPDHTIHNYEEMHARHMAITAFGLPRSKAADGVVLP